MFPRPSGLRSRLWGNTKHDLQPCLTPSHPDLNPRPVHGQHCAAHDKSPNSHSSVVRFLNLPKPHFFSPPYFQGPCEIRCGCGGTAVGRSALRLPWRSVRSQSILPIYLFNHLLNYLSVASTEGDSPERACFLVTSSLADGKPLFVGTLEIQRVTYLYINLE